MNKERILIIGIGNYLMGDDGLGIHVINMLKKENLPDNIEIVDGATNSLNLINYFENKKKVIIIDAINLNKEPGELIFIEGDKIKNCFKLKYSIHEIGVSDLLDTLVLLDLMPEKLYLIGLQPDKMELKTKLSKKVEKNLNLLIEKIKELVNA